MSEWNQETKADPYLKTPSLTGPKYLYSSKYLPSQRRWMQSSSQPRIIMDSEVPPPHEKAYNIHKEDDELILIVRSVAMIESQFKRASQHLEMANSLFSHPVGSFLDTHTTSFEAWCGITAEAIRVTALPLREEETESDFNDSKPDVKRLRMKFKNIIQTNIIEISEVIQTIMKKSNNLENLLKKCGKVIDEITAGFRSRFYQAVWQADCQASQATAVNSEDPGSPPDHELHKLNPSFSSSSLLSINLIKPVVRWDMDGLAIRKQVSKSWPLLKFSSLSPEAKISHLSEILSGFISFLTLYQAQMCEAGDVLKSIRLIKNETSMDSGQNGNDRFVKGLTYLYATLLSERYFFPPEQKKSLLLLHKLRDQFTILNKLFVISKKYVKEVQAMWLNVFKSGDLNVTSSSSCTDMTSVPLWKSCKEHSFHLDLCVTYPSVQSRFSLSQDAHKQNFVSQVVNQLEYLEDFETSYKTRLAELQNRTELVIRHSDMEHCTDLAQQLYFSIEHIVSTLHKFDHQLAQCAKANITPVPTDAPLSTSTYFSRQNRASVPSGTRNLKLFRICAWQAAILELLYSIVTSSSTLSEARGDKKSRSRLEEIASLRNQCFLLSKSLLTLAKMIKVCENKYKECEKYIETIVAEMGKYYDPVQDHLKLFSRVSSTEPMGTSDHKKEDLSTSPPDSTETSIFVTVNGIYASQKGEVFSSRIDTLRPELKVQIVEMFLRYSLTLVQQAISLCKEMVRKFGTSNPFVRARISTSNSSKLLSKVLQGLQDQSCRGKPQPVNESFFLSGSLEDNVYRKTIFEIFNSICKSFSKPNVKMNLKLSNELEALILIRLTRILEEQVVQFGQTNQNFSEELSKVQVFNDYFEKTCMKIFDNRGAKVITPLERWSDRICCFQVAISDVNLKTEFENVLKAVEPEIENPIVEQIPELTRKAKQTFEQGPILRMLSHVSDSWISVVKNMEDVLNEENMILPDDVSGSESESVIRPKLGSKSNFLSRVEAAATLFAFALTQLALDSYPRKYVLHLVKKLKSSIMNIQERNLTVAIFLPLIRQRAEKMSAHMQKVVRTYLGPGVSKLGVPDFCGVLSLEDGETSKSCEDLNENVSSSGWKSLNSSLEATHLSHLDVLVSLGFPYDSITLRYAGYENSVHFRRWSHRPKDQLQILNILLNIPNLRSEEVATKSKEFQNELTCISRRLKKLEAKLDASLPLTLDELHVIIARINDLQMQMRSKHAKIMLAVEESGALLQNAEKVLQLALSFLEFHVENTLDDELTSHDATATLRNPKEKQIRELFSKPICLPIPSWRFTLKLW